MFRGRASELYGTSARRAGAEPLPAGQLRAGRFPEQPRGGPGQRRLGGQLRGSARSPAASPVSQRALRKQPPEARGSTLHGAGGSRWEGADEMALVGMSRPRNAGEIGPQGDGMTLSSSGYPPKGHACETEARRGALTPGAIPTSSQPVAQHGSRAGVLRVN